MLIALNVVSVLAQIMFWTSFALSMLDRPFLPKKPSVLCGPCIMTSFLGATLFGVMWAMNFENHKHHYIGSIILSLTGLIALARYFRFYGRIHECTTV